MSIYKINRINTPAPEPMTDEAIKNQYQQLFTAINNRLFNGELPPIKITFPEIGNENCYACFSFDTETKEKEIILQYQTDSKIGISTDDIEDLFHEMTHYYCHINHINDTEKRNGTYYHNLNFKKAIEDHGGTCDYSDDKEGYCIDHLPSDLLWELFTGSGTTSAAL